MAKVDGVALRNLLLSVPIVEQVAREAAEEELERAKRDLFDSIEEHPVSREIMAGPDSQTDFLPDGYGNLFSFLGFDRAERPIERLIYFLDDKIKISKQSRRFIGAQTASSYNVTDEFIFDFSLPTDEEVDRATALAWTGGRGWVGMVENGVNNFSFYMFLRGRTSASSRSGRGLQIKHALREGTFTGTSYLSYLIQGLVSSTATPVNIGSVRI